jgi:hypothetical protein
MKAKRISLLLGILALFTLGADEPKAPAQGPAAHREKGYQLTVQFGLQQDAPLLRTDLFALGVPFAVHKRIGFRVLATGGQIEVPQDGKFHGILHYVDYSVPKDGGGQDIGDSGTQTLELELGKPYGFGVVGGLGRSYIVTLSRKPQ